MRKKVLVHLPGKSALKFYNGKIAELRYHFGDDVVFNAIWRYWNIKEDQREVAEEAIREALRKNEEEENQASLSL